MMPKSSEICVPLESLSLSGETGSAVAPAQGDEVDITGTATVSRIEGQMAYLTPKTINGAPVESAEPAEQEMGLDDEELEMRKDATATDRKTAGGIY